MDLYYNSSPPGPLQGRVSRHLRDAGWSSFCNVSRCLHYMFVSIDSSVPKLTTGHQLQEEDYTIFLSLIISCEKKGFHVGKVCKQFPAVESGVLFALMIRENSEKNASALRPSDNQFGCSTNAQRNTRGNQTTPNFFCTTAASRTSQIRIFNNETVVLRALHERLSFLYIFKFSSNRRREMTCFAVAWTSALDDRCQNFFLLRKISHKAVNKHCEAMHLKQFDLTFRALQHTFSKECRMFRMLQHTKRQVELFEMHCFTMFITALCVIFLMKLQRTRVSVMQFFS